MLFLIRYRWAAGRYATKFSRSLWPQSASLNKNCIFCFVFLCVLLSFSSFNFCLLYTNEAMLLAAKFLAHPRLLRYEWRQKVCVLSSFSSGLLFRCSLCVCVKLECEMAYSERLASSSSLPCTTHKYVWVVGVLLRLVLVVALVLLLHVHPIHNTPKCESFLFRFTFLSVCQMQHDERQKKRRQMRTSRAHECSCFVFSWFWGSK